MFVYKMEWVSTYSILVMCPDSSGQQFLQILQEDFGDDGASSPGKSQSDGPAAGRIQRARNDLMGESFQHQLLRDGHPQLIADESHDQGIIPETVSNARLYRALGDEVLDVVVAPGGLDDKGVLEKVGQRHALLPGQRVPFRENGAERIVQKGIEFQIVCHDGREKPAIDLPADDPVTDLIVISIQDLNFHLGIMFPEIVDHPGDPQGGNTGKAADPELAFDLVVDVEGGLAQLGFLVDHFLDVRDQLGSVVS